ncbi:MAG: amidohydrolase family protein [Lachnospiraceae bacterium]|nr:amidohydrolase family protein [Lachnospiraceae bacterium]MBR7075979.1 amidohydrolase family protein [Lachnospiraceae bacterium]
MIPAELHAHVFMDGIDYQKSAMRFRDGVDKDAVRSVLKEYQSRGITMIRDGGDHYGACIYAKSIAGEYGITYLMPSFAIFKEGNYGKIVGRPYRDIKEYRTRISEAASLGSDFIKIMVSGILDFSRFGVVSETDYSDELVKELVHIAHEEGFAVMAHASGTESVRRAAIAGADSIEHGYYMDAETMDILKEKGLIWVPTAVTSANLSGTGRFPEKIVEQIADTHKAAIAEAASKDVPIGCGSDAGAFSVLHGSGCIQEYDLLSSLLGKDADKKLLAAEQTIRQKFSGKTAEL